MKNILVIEDEKIARINILEMLGLEGFHATGAADGLLGLRLAEEIKPDLILCDISMPGLDGFEVLGTLQKNGSTANIPFIFLSGHADLDNIRTGLRLGADGYLTKPFTRNELLEAVRNRLAKHEAAQKQVQQKMQDLRSNISQMLPHELLTPVSIILMSSEILKKHRESISPEQVTEVVERIYNNAARLQKLVQNFLVYAELTTIGAEPEKVAGLRNCRTKNTRAVISEVVSEVARAAGREGDLSLQLHEGVVQIGEGRLRKLVEEVVDNAFKYSSEGTSVRVTSLSGNGMYTVYVTDNGRGMSEEEIRGLGAYVQFERKIYEQQGSGLGLIIARKLAELHGGSLRIESIPGRQTIVRIAFPLAV